MKRLGVEPLVNELLCSGEKLKNNINRLEEIELSVAFDLLELK